MNGLTRFVLKRPITTLMAVLCLIVFGYTSVTSMSLENIPDMEMPVQVALEDSAETADSKAVLTVVMVDREVDIRSIISKVATWMICLMTFSEICSMEEVLQVAAEGHQDLPEDLEVKALNQKVLISRQVSL